MADKTFVNVERLERVMAVLMDQGETPHNELRQAVADGVRNVISASGTLRGSFRLLAEENKV